MTPILQCNPKASYLSYKDEIDSAITKVLQEGVFIHGPEVRKFEEEFAYYVGSQYAVAVANGTQALEIALRALGIGLNDRVVTVAHTAVATVAAICSVGAIPVLIDCDGSHTIDPLALKKFLENDRTNVKAILVVHLYGNPADMDAIVEIASKYEVALVEDCAQAHGARANQQKVGTFGDVAAFSFYPTKNLGAFGDGGIILTNKVAVQEGARQIREYGWRNADRISVRDGINSRLDEVQAAILRVKLRHLDEDNAKRQTIATTYDQRLSGTRFLKSPDRLEKNAPVYHQYVVCVEKRDDLQRFLLSNGVNTAVHYPVPVHLHPGFAGRVEVPFELGMTEAFARKVLSLPMFPELPLGDVGTVSAAIMNWEGAQTF
ncbi:MAG: DegT/DnrJ/EryC1/StrS family aminotransferase [Bacilli bacterium]